MGEIPDAAATTCLSTLGTPSPAEQYRSAVVGVSLFDRTDRGRIEIVGKDRQRILHNLCTNEIQQLAPGAGGEAFFLDAKGKILDYAVVYHLDSATWLDVEPGRAPALIQHLDRYVIREDVRFFDRTAATFEWSLLGPKAPELLLAAGLPAELPSPVDAFPRISKIELAGCAVQLRRQFHQGFPGIVLVGPVDAANVFAERIVEAGKRMGLIRIEPATADLLRIEAGLPVMGREVTAENLAQEIGRDVQAISFKKGCYLGQETVARLDALGHVNKLLTGLMLSPGATPKENAVVRMGDKEVGHLTSWADSPRLGRPIGLAVLRVAARKPGTPLTVEVESGNSDAVATELPFATA